MPKKGYDVEKTLKERAAHIARIRKADVIAKKKKRNTWVSQLKKRIQRVLKSRHSPAGKEYLGRRK